MQVAKATVRDGTRIAYEVHGRGKNTARIALVHSLAMDRSFWQDLSGVLEAHADVLLYDCRGHGQSEKPKGPYRVELFADDLADLLDHVGWSSAVIAGASMGGCVTLAFAAAYPARARALGLIDTTAGYHAPDKWEERATKATTAGLQSMIEFQTSRWFTDEFRAAHPEIVSRSVNTFLANDPQAYAETCRMLGACDLTAALPLMKMPTAIVVGEEDYATPISMAETLHRGIAGSTLTVLEKARHLTVLEKPERIAGELQKLIETVSAQ
ncbi:MAG: alpha/beta fold hydrolase [Desulfobacterales bacterium]|nr:MAG: alpha/beta fold hydrolase [Desulfobacterales bacterium]